MLLSMRGICKSFSGVPVLRNVSFDLEPGEVHVLAGENGAGKTTLIKILAGVYDDYQGEIELNGRRVRFPSPHHAAGRGISVIHQEMSLVGTLPVIDNIFLGRELKPRFFPRLFVDRAGQLAKARELCSRLDLDIDLMRPVDEYPLTVKNRIEIAKALAVDAAILIMDEPTGALSTPEVERLYRIIGDLKRRGTAVIYITHRMEEIYRIGDRITVLRDGQRAGTAPVSELSETKLIRWMIGRELGSQFPVRESKPGAERLRLENFSAAKPGTSPGAKRHPVRNVSFSVRAGEVVGLAGLQGSGNSSLLAGLFGAFPRSIHGKVFLDGRPFRVRSPQWSIRHGLAYLPSDRKESGLIQGMTVAENISLASLEKASPWGVLRSRTEAAMARRQVQALSIRLPGIDSEVRQLSGGNQQKVLLAKWIETEPRVFLLDEPTRGVDVGVKHEIYALIRRWVAEGTAVVLITSELQELIGLSDRILVMHRGQVTAELTREEASGESILRAAMGKPWKN